MFPLRFDGNCIYIILDQLSQLLKDDGSDDKPLENETDIADSLPPEDKNRDNSDSKERTVFSNASSCSSFEPIDSYPSDLS